jgi:hypothetical protein
MAEGFEVARLGGRMVGVRVFAFSGARALTTVESSLRDIGREVGKPIFILCDLRELSDWSYTDIVSWARALRAANAYVAGGIYLAASGNDALLKMLRLAADSTGHSGRRICTSVADVTERARDLDPTEQAAATGFFFEQRPRKSAAKPIMKP